MEKYSFVQRLGQGSFAVVWKARRKSDGRLVAAKQLKTSPESWEACKQLPEVRAAAQVADRRHLVQLLEAVRHGGELFLIFEYIEGSLHHCIATATRRLEESQVRWAARRLMMALAAVHAANLVHCDVKPENILVGGMEGSRGPTMKLCDFGQSGPPGEIASYIGTRWYRAPELFLGSRGDQSVDLWSAGCTLAELILRRPLVPGSDTRDMLFRISGELGVPEESWPLASQVVEVSGRAHAEAGAWDALREQGASEASIELLGGLLRYDSTKRLRADRALRDCAFFAETAEVPIPVPTPRSLSPGSLQHAREEAQAVERRLASAGKATLPLPPPAPRGVPSAYKAESTVPSSPEPSPHAEADSEDEALADAFWTSCKAAASAPAPPPPRPRPPRTSARLRKVPLGLSAAPRSTIDSPASVPSLRDESADDRGSVVA
mmetsp:Transcript_6723/g.15259  ORF Transcript_6723/g.15259 Transcript_6723/m.15259 type:complete len:436 (-) Transcript_6723:45-1352(-)